MLSTTFISLCLFALFQAAACFSIKWIPCPEGEFNSTLPVQCGALRVPLDYSQTNRTNLTETITLELVKIPALSTPSKGSIQLNFGGPGAPSREAAVALGPLLQQMSGGAYDLVTFDPRGTGKTIPYICTNDSFLIGQIMAEIRSPDESDTALQRLLARSTVAATICQQGGNGREIGRFISTAYVVRDMMSVVDALHEDGLLRYWGFSYGTTLGATAAAMFPDKIGKMVIDGVQNPHEYYHAQADFEEWSDTDAVLSYYFTSCLDAGPTKCALASLNKTAATLEADLWSFIDSTRTSPIPISTTLIDLVAIKGLVLGQLKDVSGWPALSQALAVLLYGTTAQRNSVLAALVAALEAEDAFGPSSFALTQSLLGIHCGDRTVRASELSEIQGDVARLGDISKLAGDLDAAITTHCAQWPWRAAETYAGDFLVRTKNPVLVATNRRDSHTPRRSAVNVSAGLLGSGFLEVDGTGHCTISAPSPCSFRALVAYWINGTLPEPDSVCETAQPFDNYTWAEAIQEATGANLTAAEKRAYRRSLTAARRMR
ncbi:hypothetical protein QBC43DRAFT_238407 [Cladorrhinum sp. PSN259]|nr:hypothetical protein QBC43DRAFT_238407 [Cladorrhinum sp. PSN259]